MKKYTKVCMVGTGANGSRVYKVINQENSKIYAMKKILFDKNKEQEYNLYMNEVTINEIEINILKDLDHPSIIKFYDSFIYKHKICIIMEFAEGGDLKSIIKDHQNRLEIIEEDQIWRWFYELCEAIKYLHNRNIIHRDIKVQNVFLDKEKRVKLGDFGISKILMHSMDFAVSSVGTPFYLSPEICEGAKYNFKADMWMLGCLLYELMTLKRPFEGDNIHSLIKKILNEEYEPINTNYSKELKNIVGLLLEKNQHLRYSIEEIFDLKEFANKMKELNNQNNFSNSYNNYSNSNNSENIIHSLNNRKKAIETFRIPKIKKEKFKLQLEVEDYNSAEFKQTEDLKKNYCPSYNDNFEIDKYFNNIEISPMNKEIKKPLTVSKLIKKTSTLNISPFNKGSVSQTRKISTGTTSSSSTAIHHSEVITNFSKYDKNTQDKPIKPRKGHHIKHISINISSIQSPEHNAIYHVENIETIKNVEFKQANFRKVPKAFTPQYNLNNKDAPQMKKLPIPKSTKVKSTFFSIYDEDTHENINKDENSIISRLERTNEMKKRKDEENVEDDDDEEVNEDLI